MWQVTLLGGAANADNRLTFSASSSIVLQGTPSTFTPTVSAVSENSSYDWSNFKWEITPVLGTLSDATAQVWQLNTAPCDGSISGASGNNRTCTTALRENRTLVSAATTYASASSATLKIVANQGSGVLRIRSWLDRNGNNQLDAYEPASTNATLQVLDPLQAKPFVNFQIEPPTLSVAALRAWVSSGSVIGGNNTISGLVDPAKLSIQLNQCQATNCSAVSGSTTWVPHPQLLAYEFTSEQRIIPNSRFGAQLIYTKSSRERYVLATKEFDYTSQTPSHVQTSVSAPSGLVYKSGFKSPHSEPRQKTYLADGSLSTFVYTATLKDKFGYPVAGKQIFLAFDLRDVTNHEGILVNGQQISRVDQDLVYLSRVSDSEGKVTLNVTYSNHAWLDRIGIDAIVNGLHSWEFLGDGGEELVTWDNARNRVIGLSFSKASSTNESNKFLTAVASVSDKEGRATNGERVIFGGESPIIVDDAIQVISNGSASTNVRLSSILDESGSAVLRAQIVGDKGIVESQALISWTNYGETITGSVIPGASNAGIAGALLGASVKVSQGNQAVLSVPGTTQTAGVVFLVNGRKVTPIRTSKGLMRKIALAPASNSIKILVNGVLAASYSSSPKSKAPIFLTMIQ